MGFPARLNRVLLELMGAAHYTPPQDPSRLMADFYLLQILDAGTQHVPSHRQQELDYELDQARQQLVPYLRQHLLDKAGYSIACELRHLFDEAFASSSTTASGPGPYQDAAMDDQDWAEQALKLLRAVGVAPELAQYLYQSALNNDRPQPSRLDLGARLQCARAGAQLFANRHLLWTEGYGGPPWALACRSWLSLYQARGLADTLIYIDKLYSTEHNNGSLLDKNEGYQSSWIKFLLDLKFQANDPEELIKYASPYMRQLGLLALKDRYGRGFDPKHGRVKGVELGSRVWQQLQLELKAAMHPHGLMVMNTTGDRFAIYGAGRYVCECRIQGRRLVIVYNQVGMAALGYQPPVSVDLEDQDALQQAVQAVKYWYQQMQIQGHILNPW